MLDDALVHYNSYTDDAHDGVSILVVLDDALVRLFINLICFNYEKVSILVVLDDALVPSSACMAISVTSVSQSLLCWTML